jgi:DNA-binding ferritin-like protein (Dps family)
LSVELLNAFRPGAALEDPFLFAGRQKQVIDLAKSLHELGTCPIIYGARGLGKSSLALQAQRIAMGDVTLLEDYNERRWILGENEAYIAFYVPCSDSIKDARGILQRVINSFSSVTTSEPPEPNQLIDRTTTKRITLKPFQAETIKRYQVPDDAPTYDALEIDEKLLDMASRLSQNSGQRILVIIDELDLVRDTSGLASFIKNVSSDDLKFLLVGIGQNVSALLGDHRSIERIVVPIRVPLMTEPELSQIIDRAMDRLAELGRRYVFNRSSSLSLARLASGFPWFVHVLGQAALLAADDANRTTVTRDDVELAVQSLADNRFAQQFRDQYQTAVRESVKREMVLRTFARWPGQDIPTSEIYRVLRRLDVANPSPYVGHLSSDSYGRILLRPPDLERGMLRFANEMFRVYVKVREPTFNVDGLIRNAWRAEFRGTPFADDADPILPT